MTIHREGYKILTFFGLFLVVLNLFIYVMGVGQVFYAYFGVSLFCFLMVLQFFRSPDRIIPEEENAILSPADGSIVVLENTRENEYFHDDRIQISIFMSPLNVHLNRIPVTGEVVYQKHHPGNYLVAWHPKSSILNERNSVVIKKHDGEHILLRQIAGFLARRIVSYKKQGDNCTQGEELGFIKFGSRVDIFLPPGCKLNVEIDQEVKAGQSVLAWFSD